MNGLETIMRFTDLESLILFITIYLLSAYCFSFYKSDNKFTKNIGVFLSVLLPSVFAGIRYDVGTDYSTYFNIFSTLKNINFIDIFLNDSNLEIGFLIISKLLGLFFDEKTIFGIYAFITLSVFVHTILTQYRQYELTLSYTFFLFFTFSASLNIMRQCIAVVLVFYSLKYVYTNKLLPFLSIILISMTFHFSAILAVPLYLLWNHKKGKNIEKKQRILIIAVAVVFVAFWQVLLKNALSSNILFVDKYSNYLEGRAANNITFYVKSATTICMLYFEQFISKKDFRIQMFISCYIIGTILEYMGFFIPYVKRIGLYYSITEILTIPMFINAFRDLKIARIIICILIIAYFTIDAFVLKHSDIIPYRI